MLQRLRGQIALDLRHGADAAPVLIEAATQLESLDPDLARETYLEALRAASIAGRLGGGVEGPAKAARRAPPPAGAPRAVDLLVDGLAVRFTDGYAASAPILKRALRAVCAEEDRATRDARWPWLARRVAADLFDDETWHALATRHVQIARDTGALGVLPLALNYLATIRVFEGNLDDAAAALDEADAIAEATGSAPVVPGRLLLAGARGDETGASALFEASERAAIARGEGVVLTFSEHARSALYNGLGRYEAALGPAQRASTQDELSVSVWALPELVEAATRSGRAELGAGALERLCERTQAAGTQFAYGIEARSRALLTDGEMTEELYREAVDRLGRCRVALELARARLLYGEWLRREGRRIDAREQLRVAHEMAVTMRADAFAARARRELLATGETVRKRTVVTRDELTAQEAQIARLARDGLSNPEIAARLFISPRTVQYHLRKVFTKLGISSRVQLELVLPGDSDATAPN
jgi:ATP/maltotriose-dependent transcriptional regulator MalT